MIGAFLFVLGNCYGRRQEAECWRNHAVFLERVPMYSNSEPYYVVPEREYIDLELDHIYLKTLREECEID